MNHKSMKNHFLGLLTCLICSLSYGRILNPIKWATSVEKIEGNTYRLVSKSSIDSGWHLYSKNVPEYGPIPNAFVYEQENGNFELFGSAAEEDGHMINDLVFKMWITYFGKTARFEQIIKILEPIAQVQGIVEFMVCNDDKMFAPY